ncbi:MAG: TonB family protein [Acidobacteria bacterium]|nr:TonB family protein [Acidobacteriota bacterium]
MLDQLVESKSHSGENKKRSSLLLTTFVIMSAVLVCSWLYSLFAKDYKMGGDSLALSTLVAPPVVEEAPKPEPEPEPEEARQKDPNVDVRTEAIARMDEPPPSVPKEISSVKSKIPPRNPDNFTAIGNRNFNAANAPSSDYKGRVNTQGTGSDSGATGGGGDSDRGSSTPPPPPPAPKPPSKPISGGVLNGKARSLPKPSYPPAARAIRAGGAVQVQVVIDKSGNVKSASAVSGHPLLRPAAVAAARQAKFSPTMLSGQPVEVQGVITYNFVAP